MNNGLKLVGVPLSAEEKKKQILEKGRRAQARYQGRTLKNESLGLVLIGK